MFLFRGTAPKMNDDAYLIHLRAQRDKVKAEVDRLAKEIETATIYYNNVIDIMEKARMESRIWTLTQHYNIEKEAYEWYCSDIERTAHLYSIQEVNDEIRAQ